MIKFILLISLASLSLSANLLTTQISQQLHSHTQSPQISSSCPNQNINKINHAMNQCIKLDPNDNFECLTLFLSHNFNTSYNVFLKPTESQNAISFWQFSPCTFRFSNYGPYNRDIIIWEAQKPKITNLQIKSNPTKYVKTQSQNNKIFKQKQNLYEKQIQLTDQNDECPSYRISAVQAAISGCDIQGNDHAAGCIMRKINAKIDQKWDVIIQTQKNTFMSVYYFDNCAVEQSNVGIYGRQITVWKAQSSNRSKNMNEQQMMILGQGINEKLFIE